MTAARRLTGAEIRQQREAFGLTLKQLAKLAGVHWMTIWRAERRGEGSPSPLVERAIHDALDARADWVVEPILKSIERGRKWAKDRGLE